MPKTAASTERKARLTLTIMGVDYTVHAIKPPDLPARTARGWRLTRDDPKGGKVAHAITAGVLSGIACDCGNFKFRGQECKHVGALRAVGLL